MRINISYYLNYDMDGNPYNPRHDWVQDEEFDAYSVDDVVKEILELTAWIKSGQAEEEDGINDFELLYNEDAWTSADRTLYEYDDEDDPDRYGRIYNEVNSRAEEIAADIMDTVRDNEIDGMVQYFEFDATADIEALIERKIIKYDEDGNLIGTTGEPFDFRDFATEIVDAVISDGGERFKDLFYIEDETWATRLFEELEHGDYDKYFDKAAALYYTFDDIDDDENRA